METEQQEQQDPQNSDRIFTLYLEEFKILRQEQVMRVQTQNQAFNFLLITIGAAITAIITTANTAVITHLPAVIGGVLLLLPIIGCPLSFIFFDNEIMIHAAGSYIHYNRRKRFKKLTGDGDVLASHMSFYHLPSNTVDVFKPVSWGRWYVFLIPTFLPVIMLPIYVFIFSWNYFEPLLVPVSAYSATAVGSVTIIYVINLIFCYFLYKAVMWVYQNTQFQEKLRDDERSRDKG
jgi:hypothetical protein